MRTRGGVREKGKEHRSPRCSLFDSLQPKYKSCCSKYPGNKPVIPEPSNTCAANNYSMLQASSARLEVHIQHQAVLIFNQILCLEHLWPRLSPAAQKPRGITSSNRNIGLINSSPESRVRSSKSQICKKPNGIINLYTKHEPVFQLTQNTGYCLLANNTLLHLESTQVALVVQVRFKLQ